MSRLRSLAMPVTGVAMAMILAACGSDSPGNSADNSPDPEPRDSGQSVTDTSAEFQPVTIKHAFGETVIDEKPERVATIDFANQEVPLAFGIVPVGMAEMTWGDDDGDGVQQWTEDRLEELGAETPVLFDETNGYDFTAIAETDPDVILAGYSGLTQDDYDTLSQIADVVPYPDAPWATEWREAIMINAKGLGMEQQGKELVAELDQQIAQAVAKYPELEGTTAMFMTHVDPSDLSEVGFYTAADTRSKYLVDLGLEIAPSIVKASADSDEYSATMSVEQAESLSDVDVIITYGGNELISALKKDPVLSQLPAVKNDAIVNLDGTKSIGTAANPTALSVPYLAEDYVKLLADAASYTTE